VARANEETLVVVQIETRAAVEGVPEIAAVDGLDVVFIGPTDLSHALGVPGQISHPLVAEAFEKIVQGVADSPAALGVLASDETAAAEWRERGARYIAFTIDSLLARSARALLGSVRDGGPR
jgi:2-keto-3-deoxy-L-rhamnonate aldolase RhmA